VALFSRLFGSRGATFDAPIAPEVPFFAIGDVHGCASKLDRLLNKIDEIDPSIPKVLVGDYVDRGEESAKVLRRAFELSQTSNAICLIGNHEEMLLNFLEHPQDNGPRWLRYGGLQTLASFGVGGVSASTTGSDLDEIATALRDAMGHELITWLTNLPTHWVSGNIAVVHAGADPSLPISLQVAKTLRWGHPDFEKTVRDDGVWVVHGHTIVDQPSMTAGRIAIDTGAYASGKLTAAHIHASGVDFIQA